MPQEPPQVSSPHSLPAHCGMQASGTAASGTAASGVPASSGAFGTHCWLSPSQCCPIPHGLGQADVVLTLRPCPQSSAGSQLAATPRPPVSSFARSHAATRPAMASPQASQSNFKFFIFTLHQENPQALCSWPRGLLCSRCRRGGHLTHRNCRISRLVNAGSTQQRIPEWEPAPTFTLEV